VLEQIKLDIAHDNLAVVLVGDGAGFVYSSLGTSHQSTEDIACTRALPQLSIFSPADRFELAMCVDLAYAARSPVYLRLGKADRGDVHKAPVSASAGSLLNVREGRPGDICFIATGSLVATAMKLAEATFLNASVWSAPTLKPIDAVQVAGLCRDSRALVSMEEHSVHGGLGSIIAELSCSSVPRPLLRIGVNDRFSAHCGSYDYLLSEHGLDAFAVQQRINAFIDAL